MTAPDLEDSFAAIGAFALVYRASQARPPASGR
jgi:hypothetical protein